MREKLERGWAAYLALGLAPSHQLQCAFVHFSTSVRAAPADRPSAKVMNVFDRLMTTDDQIMDKRATDRTAEREKVEPIIGCMKKGRAASSWWRQPPMTRLWVFASVAWFVAVLIYTAIFDPFAEGSWVRLSDNEVLRTFIVALLPVAGGPIARAYQRWVR